MTPITIRQAHILRALVSAPARSLSVRGIVKKIGSPNRLTGDLVLLIQSKYLHMERRGREDIYTITKPGLRRLAKYDAETAGESLNSLTKIKEAEPDTNLEIALKVLQNEPLVMKALKLMESRNIRAH